ncbi:MAG: HEPN domain-containing protein [Halobacteriota archaeon]|nr:HEPN domain-containing protein [Halobacteriota archaeon]
MKNLEKAGVWLKRAKSNMARAKAGKFSPEILYEDICFDAQQAVEKALKCLCIIHEIQFPKTHDIAYLLELLEIEGVSIPDKVSTARLLTDYAVEARYPGEYEPVDEKEYLTALKIAEDVLNWVEKKMEEEG